MFSRKNRIEAVGISFQNATAYKNKAVFRLKNTTLIKFSKIDKESKTK
jgi:hypothetical protein